ncbi:hypothetical protein GUG45_10585, partial [Xanthomonas citri pv. citri]|nr:hypothetical protein [Xanthomonas citri pv. citri]
MLSGLKGNHSISLNGGPTLEADPVVDDDGTAMGPLDGIDDHGVLSYDSALTPGSGDYTYLIWVILLGGDTP